MGARIDLNADVGEGLGPWPMGAYAALIPLVTSVNVACGFHAGDPLGIRRTVRFALEAGCAVGALHADAVWHRLAEHAGG